MTGDAPIKVQQDRKKLMEGHFNISITKRVSLENSTDLGRGAAPELKSVEFLSETLLVVEQIDIHTNFTARQMLYLYRSITHQHSSACINTHRPPCIEGPQHFAFLEISRENRGCLVLYSVSLEFPSGKSRVSLRLRAGLGQNLRRN